MQMPNSKKAREETLESAYWTKIQKVIAEALLSKVKSVFVEARYGCYSTKDFQVYVLRVHLHEHLSDILYQHIFRLAASVISIFLMHECISKFSILWFT